MTPTESHRLELSDADRQRMAMVSTMFEARVYLLTQCRASPHAVRLASALAACADLIWPVSSESAAAAPAGRSGRKQKTAKLPTPGARVAEARSGPVGASAIEDMRACLCETIEAPAVCTQAAKASEDDDL